MNMQPNGSPALEPLLPDDFEAPDLAATGVEAGSPKIAQAQIGLDIHGRAFTFLSVFRHRNYRLFFAGQQISLMGTWITYMTQGWLVYSLSDSPLLLGLTYFASQVPVFFFSPFGGMLADRFERRGLMIVTQTLGAVQSAALAILTLTGVITVPEIICLATFQGLVNAFDIPARQGMTVEMVGKDDLRHAISLNSMMFNIARLVGPSLAGVLIALVNAGWCFALDAASYSAVIASLLLMQFRPRPVGVHAQPLKSVLQGFSYVWHTRQIRGALLLIACSSVFGAAYLSMLPAFARDVLHQDSAGLGFLYAAVGSASLLGAYALARLPNRHLFGAPVGTVIAFGVSLILFSQSHWYWLSFVLLLPTSFSLMLLSGATISILQLVARDDMRGRVVACYAMCVMGMLPWGALLLGWIAARLGVADAITIGGVVCVLAGAAAWRDRSGENRKLNFA